MYASKLKEDFIIENYIKAIDDASEMEHSYKQLSHQILQKETEYDLLIKEREVLKNIKQKYDESNIDPYDRL